jgi:hypothetical protein
MVRTGPTRRLESADARRYPCSSSQRADRSRPGNSAPKTAVHVPIGIRQRSPPPAVTGFVSPNAADHSRREVGVPFRYVWPSELDLMARLARMTLVERWGGWRRQPFTRDSTTHVYVWRRQKRAWSGPGGAEYDDRAATSVADRRAAGHW